MIAVVASVLLLFVIVAALVLWAFRRAVIEQHEAVAAACGMDADAFGRELTSGGTLAEVAAAHDVDAQAIIETTMLASRYRWVAKAASTRPA